MCNNTDPDEIDMTPVVAATSANVESSALDGPPPSYDEALQMKVSEGSATAKCANCQDEEQLPTYDSVVTIESRV